MAATEGSNFESGPGNDFNSQEKERLDKDIDSLRRIDIIDDHDVARLYSMESFDAMKMVSAMKSAVIEYNSKRYDILAGTYEDLKGYEGETADSLTQNLDSDELIG
mgnify:CR=1 FL=1